MYSIMASAKCVWYIIETFMCKTASISIASSTINDKYIYIHIYIYNIYIYGYQTEAGDIYLTCGSIIVSIYWTVTGISTGLWTSRVIFATGRWQRSKVWFRMAIKHKSLIDLSTSFRIAFWQWGKPPAQTWCLANRTLAPYYVFQRIVNWSNCVNDTWVIISLYIV